jgi:hypothetical protein
MRQREERGEVVVIDENSVSIGGRVVTITDSNREMVERMMQRDAERAMEQASY